jgi:asparagine synthase (glutamine-hydrolysing)
LYPETVWQEERPDITGVHTVQMLLSQETAKHFKVVLTGEGADEVLGGYPWYRMDKLSRLSSWMPNGLRKYLLMGLIGRKIHPLELQTFFVQSPITIRNYSDLISLQYPEVQESLFSDQIITELRTSHESQPLPCNMDWLASLDPFERIQYIEMKTRLCNWIIHGLDAMSMACSLEVRVAFLDHQLIECAVRIPPSLKMKYFREKYILRSVMSAKLPHEIISRRKFGLRAPSTSWLKGPLSSFAEYMFSEEYCVHAGYFSARMVRKLLQQHRNNIEDFTKPLLLVLGTHIWHAFFIEKRDPTLTKGLFASFDYKTSMV